MNIGERYGQLKIVAVFAEREEVWAKCDCGGGSLLTYSELMELRSCRTCRGETLDRVPRRFPKRRAYKTPLSIIQRDGDE
jgi:hypothetical protein